MVTSPRFRVVLSAAGIALVTLIAYGSSLGNGFVDWDDYEYVTKNPLVKELSVASLKAMFTGFYQATYDPLVFLSFSIEHALFGLNPFCFHLDNLILHLINSVLVFCLAFMLSRDLMAAVVSGALFGVHPLHVESVAWVTERKDVLATIFFLSAFLLYVSYRNTGKRMRYCGCLAAFVLSLLAKPAGVALPIILLLYDRMLMHKRGSALIADKIPLLVIALIFGAVAAYAQKAGGGVDIEVQFSALETVYIVYYSYFFYVVKALFPVGLSALYPYPQSIAMLSLMSGAAFILVLAGSVLAVVYSRRFRLASFYALFFFITLVPLLKIIPFGNALVADRYLYIPSIGLFSLFALGAVSFFNGKRKRVRWGILTAFVIIICFSMLTYERCKVWKGTLSLWTDVVNQYPQSTIARLGLGNAYREAGATAQAICEYRQALARAPTYIDAMINLGNALRAAGNHTEAQELFKKALAYAPEKPQLLLGLGDIARMEGHLEEAVSYYEAAAATKPVLPETYLGLGGVYKKQGLTEKAFAAYAQALALNHDSPDVFNEVGVFYREQGRIPEAIACYQKALAIDSRNAEALANLGWACFQQGMYEQAAEYSEKAISEKPDFMQVYDNLVQIFLQQGKPGNAVATYRRCLAANQTAACFQRLMSLYFKLGMEASIVKECELVSQNSPLYAESLLCLGDCYRKKGNLSQAEAKYRQALALKGDDPRIYFSLGMALWQKGAPADATRYLEKARALALEDPDIAVNLGILYYEGGMAEKALQEFEGALALNSTLAVPHLYLAKLYAEKFADRKKAVSHLQKVLEIDPQYPQAEKIKEDIRRLEGE